MVDVYIRDVLNDSIKKLTSKVSEWHWGGLYMPIIFWQSQCPNEQELVLFKGTNSDIGSHIKEWPQNMHCFNRV